MSLWYIFGNYHINFIFKVLALFQSKYYVNLVFVYLYSYRAAIGHICMLGKSSKILYVSLKELCRCLHHVIAHKNNYGEQVVIIQLGF